MAALQPQGLLFTGGAADDSREPPCIHPHGHGVEEFQCKQELLADPLGLAKDAQQQLPIACIAKIMANELAKSNLGYNTKISNDAKRLVQECATEFICFVMSEANSQAREAGSASVSGQQMIDACASMGFDEMVGPMSHALPHFQPAKRKRKKPPPKMDAPDKSKLPRVSGQASISTEVSEEVC